MSGNAKRNLDVIHLYQDNFCVHKDVESTYTGHYTVLIHQLQRPYNSVCLHTHDVCGLIMPPYIVISQSQSESKNHFTVILLLRCWESPITYLGPKGLIYGLHTFFYIFLLINETFLI